MNPRVARGCLLAALLAAALPSSAFGEEARPEKPLNLDLEQGALGGVPEGWISRGSNAKFGYTIELVDERPHSGSRCARISKKTADDSGGFGNLMQTIDATAYRGQRIRLTAAIRAEVADPTSAAQMWLRVDRPHDEIGFFDNMGDRPIRVADWATYTIVGEVAPDAERINFGAFLLGHGTAWADDFSIEIVGQAGEGDRPAAALEGRALENLIAYTRLLGYVRHFHPAPSVAAADWERQAVLGVEAVEKAPTPAALAAALRAWLSPMAPRVQVFVTGEDPPLPVELRRPAGEEPPRMAWQHVGVGLGGAQSIYSSEIITLDGGPGKNEAGLVHEIEATPYRGRQIRFRAAARAEVPEGGHHVALAVRVLTPGGVAFHDQMDDRPITSPEWSTYEIVGQVAENAETIHVAVGLAGHGQGWFDDIEFGPADGSAEGRLRFDFSSDEPGKSPSGWELMAGGPTVDYEGELTRAGCGGRERCATVRGNAKKSALPAPDEPFRADLGGGVSCRVPLTLWGAAGEPTSATAHDETWPGRPPGWLPSGGDRSTRLAVVALAWNVFQHFYPYFDQAQTDWNGALVAALSAAASAADDRAFLDTLRRMVAELHDGHGRVNHSSEGRRSAIPLLFDWVEEQLVITAVDPAELEGLSPGDVVRAIDGVAAAEALERAERLISGSPQWMRFRAVQEIGWGPPDSRVVLRVRTRAGDERDVTLTRSRNTWGENAVHEPRHATIAEIEPGILYVDIDRVTEEELNAALERLAAARGVVFDLRGYPRHTLRGALVHLIDEPVTSAQWNVPTPQLPDRREMTFQFSNWSLEPASPRIRGRVAFLTNAQAISAAETLLGIVEHYRLAEIVGSATAGTNGNVNPFTVAGYGFTWTGMRVLKHDGSRHHGVGIQPTIPARRSIAGIAAGRDEVLEAGLAAVRRRAP